MGCQGPGLACGRALTGASGQGAGGHRAEQDGRGGRGKSDGEGDEAVMARLQEPDGV